MYYEKRILLQKLLINNSSVNVGADSRGFYFINEPF